jgi:hypothetical protein
MFKAAQIDYDYLVGLIPDELRVKGDLLCNNNIRQHKSQLCIDDSRGLKEAEQIKQSNFSDLSLDKKKQSLVGYLVPNTKCFNATECLFDIKFIRAQEKSSE